MSSEALERAEEAIAQTWEGSDIPAGPGIPSAFQRSARLAKALAHDVVALLAEVARLEQERDEMKRDPRDVRLYARLDALAAELAVAREREQRLRDELAFYAEGDNWTQLASWGGRIHDEESAAIQDGGKRARVALVDEPATTHGRKWGRPQPIYVRGGVSPSGEERL